MYLTEVHNKQTYWKSIQDDPLPFQNSNNLDTHSAQCISYNERADNDHSLFIQLGIILLQEIDTVMHSLSV